MFGDTVTCLVISKIAGSWVRIILFLLLLPNIGSAQAATTKVKPKIDEAPQAVTGIPNFYIYKMDAEEGISVVVPLSTSDAQLRNLLWHFRKSVRQGHFREIGITRPTSRRSGKLDYSEGVISIFRGTKCANELFVNKIGPCGYGEHDDAFYQWGIEGDPNKDAGTLISKSGDVLAVFDFKDGWKP